MAKPENVTCPDCDGPMTPRTSTHGKFWGCRAYPKCKGTRNSDGEAPRRSSDEHEADDARTPSQSLRDNDRRRWSH